MNSDSSTLNDESTFNDCELQTLTTGMTLCGKYRLENCVGEEGMGVVWKAWDSIGERWVALKFLPPEIRHQDGAMTQVKTAFKTIQVLNHTNICRVYALEKDFHFGYVVVMEWLDAPSLNEVKLSKAQIPAVLEKVAEALDYAHSEMVIHRDLKPSNIFVGENGRVWINDFEIAAEIQNFISMNTSSTVCRTIGSRPYMAPEQWRGQYPDESTDQYALAVVAYQLYSARLPFESSDVSLFRMAVLQDIPEPLENISASINAAIQRALAKERKFRFASCREFVDALMGAMTSESLDPFVAFFAREEAEREARRMKLPKLALEAYQADKYAEATGYLQEYLEYDPENANAKRLLDRCVSRGNGASSVVAGPVAAETKNASVSESNLFLESDGTEYVIPMGEPQILLSDAECIFSTDETQILPRNAKSLLPTDETQILPRNAKSLLPTDETQIQISNTEKLIPAGTRKVLTVLGIDYAFRWCPPGEFMMGSPKNESGRYEDETLHKVKLTRGFWLLETEVTVEMFESFVNATAYKSKGYTPYGWTGNRWEQNIKYSWNNPGFSQSYKHPVTCVSWADAQEFCKWFSKQTGYQAQLPAEAQWEYACRAGITDDISRKLEDLGWYSSNSGTKTHMVGLKMPNAWGFYDMRGNVWEWCLDWYDEKYYAMSPANDPSGPEKSAFRVGRGGSWNGYGRDCRAASRGRDYPDVRSNSLGLRILVVSIPEE